MSETHRNRIGIFTPASPVGPVELDMGCEALRRGGFEVTVHEQAVAQDFVFGGTDQERVGAFWDLATREGEDAVDVVWCARGGYGCTHLLPLLDALTAEHGVPAKKLLVGYSDVTVLHQYVRRRWGWETLHANMPASASFVEMDSEQRGATFTQIRTGVPTHKGRTFGDAELAFFANTPASPIEADVVGGNLATWNYLTGTKYAPAPEELAGKLLFFEDVGEGFYKMDAYFTQLDQAGGLDGIAGMVLGGFHDCSDEQSTRLAHQPTREHPNPSVAPLRPTYGEREAMQRITTPIAERHGFPVAWKLPVSHGPDYWPLMLGATHRLDVDGSFSLV